MTRSISIDLKYYPREKFQQMGQILISCSLIHMLTLIRDYKNWTYYISNFLEIFAISIAHFEQRYGLSI